MPTYFIKHNNDTSPEGWYAVTSVSTNILKIIDLTFGNLQQRIMPGNKRAAVAESLFADRKRMCSLWKESILAGSYGDFKILKRETADEKEAKVISYGFNHPLLKYYRIVDDKLYHGENVLETTEVLVNDNSNGANKNWVRTIFSIGLKDEEYRFWFTMRNDTALRTKEAIFYIGCHYMTNYINRVNKRKLWSNDDESALFLDKVKTIARRKLLSFRQAAKNNPDDLLIMSKDISVTSITNAVSEINKKAFDKLIIKEGIDITILHDKPRKKPVTTVFDTSWIQGAILSRNQSYL